jgi:EAL domain-containing protein (putative c-di-GMP-specific phosphodiesterase class I)
MTAGDRGEGQPARTPLRSAGAELGSTLDPVVLMRRVAEQALTLVPGADGVLLGLSNGQHLTYMCGSGYLAAHSGTRTAVGASIGGLAVRTGLVQRCDDTETDPRVDRETTRRLGTRSTVVIPLSRGAEVFGVLAVGATRPNAFTSDDVGVLTAMAELVGVAVGIASDLSRGSAELTRFAEGDASGPGSEDVASRAGRFLMSVLNPNEVLAVDARRRVENMLDRPELLTMVFQPIVDLDAEDRVVAVEALARFNTTPYRAPDLWFIEAHQAGLGVDLELEAVARALTVQRMVPPDVAITVNVGPDTAMSPRLHDAVGGVPPRQVILELTEHTAIGDYPRLMAGLRTLREDGVRLAVDDTGSGYSSLAHILKLAPDFIKLDRDLTTGIDLDPVRRALAAALVTFANDTGALIVAEGIESKDELDVLRDLGVRYGQGYYLGRPAPIETQRNPALTGNTS